jgi:hypothetical protein
MRLDGDAALPFQIHRVEHLLLHLAVGNRARAMEQTVRKRGLTVVDVGNDAEIAYVLCVHRSNAECGKRDAESESFRENRPHTNHNFPREHNGVHREEKGNLVRERTVGANRDSIGWNAANGLLAPAGRSPALQR